jgi:ABC-type nitrate/sulfonate/bicarbonate transport system permease component
VKPLGPVHRTALGLTGVLAVVALLEILPRTGAVDRRFLPPSTEIAAALADRAATPAFWTALGQTLTTWLLGLAVATLAGVVLGAVIGSAGWVRAATSSTIEFLRPIPSVALVPLVVLLHGTGVAATLLLVVYAAFWPVLLQVLAGVADVDPLTRETARVYRYRRLTVATHVVGPSALPYVVTGFRLAASVALVLTLTGELVVGTPGLGRLLAVAQQSGAVAPMYALVVVTGLLGVAVNLGVRALERKVLRWHPSVRREVAA